MKTTILWFRRDLRLYDNPAVNWACNNSDNIIPIYIYSPEEEHPWEPGGASRWWLHNSLKDLEQQLSQLGLKLYFFSGSSEKIIDTLIKSNNATSLVYNRLYEPHLQQRDSVLESTLSAKIKITSFESGLFFKPGTVLNNQQHPYKVFTPFYKKTRELINTFYASYTVYTPEKALKKLTLVKLNKTVSLNQLKLLDKHPWHKKLHPHWQPGETNTHKNIDRFLEEAIEFYKDGRDIPSANHTSKLSSHLHFGEVTPQQLYLSTRYLIDSQHNEKVATAAEVFIKQLLWREFAHHILWFYPNTSSKPMNSHYKSAFWKNNKKQLALWQKGQTGIPIVDAGMQQLWETGWMHNRVRMVASSFLTKNLGIHWIHGAKWFWETLVDANLANNSMGWQWVAGCGVDAAPYYRVFNPERQAERFDKNNVYIDHWLSNQKYTKPIINLSESREKALERYKTYIKQS